MLDFELLHDPCDDCIVGFLCNKICELKTDYETTFNSYDYQCNLRVYYAHEKKCKEFIKMYLEEGMSPLQQMARAMKSYDNSERSKGIVFKE